MPPAATRARPEPPPPQRVPGPHAVAVNPAHANRGRPGSSSTNASPSRHPRDLANVSNPAIPATTDIAAAPGVNRTYPNATGRATSPTRLPTDGRRDRRRSTDTQPPAPPIMDDNGTPYGALVGSSARCSVARGHNRPTPM